MFTAKKRRQGKCILCGQTKIIYDVNQKAAEKSQERMRVSACLDCIDEAEGRVEQPTVKVKTG